MEGASGIDHGGRRSRTGMDRLDATPAAIARSEEFRGRVKQAEGDVILLSDMMAEAIAMDREARALEGIGRDGRSTFCIERLCACHCMDAAREAYRKARGSNAAV